jgi:hypothetical protein
MDKKPMWLQVLTTTTNLFSIGAIIIGMSTMIAAIYTVWHALTFKEQIIVAVAGSFFMIAVILFIWGQTRKVLYTIPDLLLNIHKRGIEVASELNVDEIDPEKLYMGILNLIGVDPNIIMKPITSELDIADLNKVIYLEYKAKVESDEMFFDRFCTYLSYMFKLKEKLDNDKKYSILKGKVNKIRFHLPTEEMAKTIISYYRDSEQICSLIPLSKIYDESIQKELPLEKILPLDLRMDYLRAEDKIDDDMNLSFSKIRESIERYYGKLK